MRKGSVIELLVPDLSSLRPDEPFVMRLKNRYVQRAQVLQHPIHSLIGGVPYIPSFLVVDCAATDTVVVGIDMSNRASFDTTSELSDLRPPYLFDVLSVGNGAVVVICYAVHEGAVLSADNKPYVQALPWSVIMAEYNKALGMPAAM